LTKTPERFIAPLKVRRAVADVGRGTPLARHSSRLPRAMSTPLKVLHTYKVYRPDVDGGIPFAIASLSKMSPTGVRNEILVARLKGLSRKYAMDGVPVRAVFSFGTLFSTPAAPTYPFALLRRAKSNDILVHHAPFPVVDIALPYLSKCKPLIVYWHA